MARFRTPSADTFAGRIAQAIRAEMLRQNLTQQELADKLGWTQRRVSYRLTGDQPIDVAELEAVARVLGVPLSALIPADDTPAEVTA
jgi:transcriptional regulator with XRE-family HTH domain